MENDYLLLPCPFCGGSPLFEQTAYHSDVTIVKCSNCGCNISANRAFSESHADCIRRLVGIWNTRPKGSSVRFLAALHDQLGDPKFTITFQTGWQLVKEVRRSIRGFLSQNN